MADFTQWHTSVDDNHIFWAGLDKSDSSVNSINQTVLEELEQLIHQVQHTPSYKGLVIYSKKSKGFIAGADIQHFSSFQDSNEIVNFLHKGQQVFNQLEQLSIPTVAMIEGFCMGGGFELALACDYRIATDEASTRLGLPEILLGIHPGWGGTVRLPKLIGGFEALSKVILTGRAFSAKAAKRLGMIDDAVPVRQIKRAAVHYIQHQPTKHKPSFLQAVTNHAFSRRMLAKLLRQQVAKKVDMAHYPAFKAAIDIWELEGGLSEKALAVEADSIAGLISKNDTAKNLIRAYFLREQMKSYAKHSDFIANHVHVVGAGIMGGDIAAWCALKGCKVTLQDRNFEAIAPAIARAYKLFKKKLKEPRLVQAAMDRLMPDVNGLGVAKADVIIEAIFEDLEAKQRLFKALEQQAKPDALLATNTSSIPLDEINTVLVNPERLLGIHFFNPVAKMELVEVVEGKCTDPTALKQAFAFVGQIGRLPLPVKSSPGFLVNRVLMPYLMECVALLEEGYTGEIIDLAAKRFGMMMGPVELADTVGLDVCLAVAKNLTHHFGGEVPQKLKQLVAEGALGKKTGQGFYQYDKKGKAIKQKSVLSEDNTIANRLILRMVNESAACLREGVVNSADLLDGGMIFGAGFAPFRGGPMQYAQTFGEGKLNALFKQLEQTYGARFKADQGLE